MKVVTATLFGVIFLSFALLVISCFNPNDDDDVVLTGKLAFLCFDDFYGEIYTVNADGSDLTQLTNISSYYDRYGGLSWSPDGSKLAFCFSNASIAELYTMNADGTNITRLTNDIAREDQYGYMYYFYGEDWSSWSPDGERIIFESYRDNPFEENGTTISNANLYIVNSDGSGADLRVTNNLYYEGMASWSPNGNKIAFVHSVDPVDNYSEGYHIYTMDVNGSNWERITISGSNNTSPKFSPDGNKIVFTDDEAKICIYNLSNETLQQLNVYGEYPSWSPDGTMIIYDNYNKIYVMNIDGTNIREIVLDIGARKVVWTE